MILVGLISAVFLVGVVVVTGACLGDAKSSNGNTVIAAAFGIELLAITGTAIAILLHATGVTS
jgi:hypothetical protein